MMNIVMPKIDKDIGYAGVSLALRVEVEESFRARFASRDRGDESVSHDVYLISCGFTECFRGMGGDDQKFLIFRWSLGHYRLRDIAADYKIIYSNSGTLEVGTHRFFSNACAIADRMYYNIIADMFYARNKQYIRPASRLDDHEPTIRLQK
jgi:hypothetical protein